MPIHDTNASAATSLGDLPPDARARVGRELDDGEALRWVGRPDPGHFARRGWVTMVYGILFAGFALVWTAGAGGLAWFSDRRVGAGNAPVLFPLFGLVFVVVGLALVSTPFRLLWQAGRTLYAVTDRRAIIWSGGWSPSVRSIAAHALSDVERRERPDGSGDLVLTRDLSAVQGKGYRQGRRQPVVNEIGFFGVANVRAVERITRGIA